MTKKMTKQTDNAGKKNLLQIIKFVFVGILNTALDYGLFFVFFGLLDWDKNLAQICATAIAMTNSYLFNRYWTFEQKGKVKAGEMWKFVVINLLSMGVTLLCLNLFYDVWHLERLANALLSCATLRFRLEGDLAVLFCKLAAMPFSLAVNFLGNRFWVFHNQKQKSDGE